ncbi:MAG TPA: 4Fe-4S dicluster domain-containing protein [Methanospirillum sp.]|nr:4Fe-4S dicluster domain-containing protein [Methanospirillum sp.]
MHSFLLYLRNILRRSWIREFFLVRTEPLESPDYFRDTPHLTGRGCTHCYLCMTVCPSPGAIVVIKEGMPAKWTPQISAGHCIRCGLCVEVCPELVLDSGRIFPMTCRSETFLLVSCHIHINQVTCMGCGSCVVGCPINKRIDYHLAGKGTSSSDEVIIRIENGFCTVLHAEKCTGCKTCEEGCPNRAIMVTREIQAGQMVYEEDPDEQGNTG